MNDPRVSVPLDVVLQAHAETRGQAPAATPRWTAPTCRPGAALLIVLCGCSGVSVSHTGMEGRLTRRHRGAPVVQLPGRDACRADAVLPIVETHDADAALVPDPGQELILLARPDGFEYGDVLTVRLTGTQEPAGPPFIFAGAAHTDTSVRVPRYAPIPATPPLAAPGLRVLLDEYPVMLGRWLAAAVTAAAAPPAPPVTSGPWPTADDLERSLRDAIAGDPVAQLAPGAEPDVSPTAPPVHEVHIDDEAVVVVALLRERLTAAGRDDLTPDDEAAIARADDVLARVRRWRPEIVAEIVTDGAPR